MQAAVFCSLLTKDVRPILKALRKAGIPERQVSILCADTPLLESAYASGEEGEGLPQATSLIVTGIGPCVVSGPVAQMLVGTPAGRLISGLTAGLGDLSHLIGIAGDDHAQFQDALRHGKGLILVHYGDEERRKLAHKVFEEFGASTIRTAGQAARAARAESAP